MNWTDDAVRAARNQWVRLRDGRTARVKHYDGDGWALVGGGLAIEGLDIWQMRAVLNGNEAVMCE